MTLALGLKDVKMLGVLGETDALRITLPEKPRLLSVIVDDAPPEPHNTGPIGPALRVKSALTVNETVVG